MKGPNKLMNPTQLPIHLANRVIAVATAAAIFVAPVAVTFASPPNHERQKSEHAVQRLRHIIVIYQENWSLDSLYGQFPGADGYANSFDTLLQLDRKAAAAGIMCSLRYGRTSGESAYVFQR
jgi:phospholipase C